MQTLDSYSLEVEGIVADVNIVKNDEEFVPQYLISVVNISKPTSMILGKIRERFVEHINKGKIQTLASGQNVREEFRDQIKTLIISYFPNAEDELITMLMSYVVMQYLGFGDLELLLKDSQLEEIVINGAKEPVWVYHRKHAWLKTNINLESEDQIRHYATMIGKDVGKQITVLEPLMDAHLLSGDRVNATLNPISNLGNTITIRKFAATPWTITQMIKSGTISYEGAALLWLSMQHEMSILIAGGTGSGKTSILNVLCNFLPPNQRIISIEDTRELQLPKTLHWVPMETRLPNPEGKGGVSMLDLVVNSLRMRPDRILVGEIRRKTEAEVLFEAMHTGHSVYGTLHANTAQETVIRLTNPPIDIPKLMLPALGLIVVQNRNRRTGKRRTMQIAEITEGGDANVLLQYNAMSDSLEAANESVTLLKTLGLYTGLTKEQLNSDLEAKKAILKSFVDNDISDINKIGMVIADYYLQK